VQHSTRIDDVRKILSFIRNHHKLVKNAKSVLDQKNNASMHNFNTQSFIKRCNLSGAYF